MVDMVSRRTGSHIPRVSTTPPSRSTHIPTQRSPNFWTFSVMTFSNVALLRNAAKGYTLGNIKGSESLRELEIRSPACFKPRSGLPRHTPRVLIFPGLMLVGSMKTPKISRVPSDSNDEICRGCKKGSINVPKYRVLDFEVRTYCY